MTTPESARSPFFIRQGDHFLSGHWNAKVWVLHHTGKMPQKFRLLKNAKARAVELGASGKWTRCKTPTGPRGLAQVNYIEVMP